MTNEEKIILAIIKILKTEEQTVKLGSNGDYEQEQAVTSDCYHDVSVKIHSFIQSITDPENQPNQYGIKL